MKSIVHCIESTATGTLSIMTLAVNHQAKVGKSVTVIYSRRDETPDNLETLFHDSVNLVEVSMKPKDILITIIKLRALLGKINPDKVHCHSSFAGFIGRLAAIGLKADVYYSPHCISFMRKDISKLKSFLFKALEAVACIKPSTYIACSESERLAIKQALPFVDVKLLENAVDLSEFNASSRQATKTNGQLGPYKIMTVGGIRPQKGPAEFALIASQFEDKDLEFIWVGDGDDAHRQALIESGVKVTGWKSRSEVIELLYQSDLYLSTALWEGMPVSVIEACAAGLPVVARNCSGNSDIISDGNNGYLFNDTNRAVEVINQFIIQPESFQKLAIKAKHEVFNRFSIERFSAQLERIYNS